MSAAIEVQGEAGKIWLIGKAQFAAWRQLVRSIGPKHALVDRWRHDLGWNIEASVVKKFLASEKQ